MRIHIVRTVCFKEVRDLFRDRRTLYVTLLLPLILYPLLMIGFSFLTVVQMGKIEKQRSRVVLIDESRGIFISRLDTLSGLTIQDSAGWRESIPNGTVDAALRLSRNFDRFANSDSGSRAEAEIFFNSSREVSVEARDRLRRALDDYKNEIVRTRLVALNTDTTLLEPFRLVRTDLASQEQRQGAYLGKLLGYLLIIMTLMGAFYPAIDLTAGEKERGTLETLLVSPASRSEIVYGKFLATLALALLTAALNILSIGVTMIYMVRMLGGEQMSTGLALQPASLLLAFALILPLAVLFAAICLAIAAGARTYKEGQALLTPLYSLVILPAMFSLLPGTEMSPTLAMIPLVNISLLIKDFMTGNYPWLETGIAFASTSALAAAALAWAVSQFRQESVLFRHAESVRWSPFRMAKKSRELPTPGSAMTLVALQLILLFSISSMALEWGIIKTILVSQLAVFLPAAYMIYRGGYDVASFIKLRAPRLRAWPAALLTMFGGWIFSIQLAALQHHWMPFPPDFIERFTQLFEVLNTQPLIIAIALIAVLPGIVEEFVCRGIVLRSLLPRFGPAGAIVISAVAFGILHLDPYRLLATTWLGLLLGYVAFSTGSILPAMFGHALNNSLSFLVQKFGSDIPFLAALDEGTSILLPWSYLLAAAILLMTGLLMLRATNGQDAVARRQPPPA